MPTNIFDEARKRVSSGTSVSSSQSDNIFSQARSRVNTGQTVDSVKSSLPNRKTNMERMDLGQNEWKIGTGWEKRVDLDHMWGEPPAASAYDRKIAEKKSQLDATAPNSSNMNDSTRYQILQDIRQLEKDKEIYDKGKEEQFNTAKWEAQQRLSIAATMDQNLFDNLVRLNELKKTSSAEGIYSSFGVTSGTNAKEQYNSLYRQLYEKYGDDVKDWLEYTSRVKNREETELQMQKAAQIAKEHPILSSAVSIPANLGSGLGYLDVAAQRINRAVTGSDTPIDYNTPAMYPSKLTNTIRGSVSQKIAEDTEGKIGSDTPLGNLYSAGYNLAMSMGDSALAMATGGGTALIGAAAATNAMNEAVSRGASTDQALAIGLIAGTMESVMEKVSIDSLFNIKAPGNLRQAILNILKQGGVEATEEAATTLANTLADAIIMGDKSDLKASQRKYMSMGYSYSEAEKKALADWGMGLVGDALGGFVSGGLFSSGKEIATGIYNRKSALDFAIEETLKPTQEQTNLDRAMEGLFEQNKAAKVDTGAESTNVNTDPAVHTPLEQDFNGNTDQSDVMDHGAVGAAEIGFNPYSHFQNQTDNFLPEGANAARLVDMPAVDPTGKPVRRGAKTIYGAQTTSDARAEQMETEYMEGLYGYDPVRDKPTLEKAKAKIAQDGYDRAYARVTERLQSMKKLKETGLEAYLLYADAVKNGNDADAAELCLLLTQSGTEFAQGVQLFSMFRKLTPEGQLMGVERLVQRINDKYRDSKKDNTIPDYAKNDVINEITDVRDTALRLLENIHAAFDKTGENHGVPVENWIAEIGNQLAKTLEKSNGNSNRSTISKTIKNDLSRFARAYFDRSKPGNNYSNAQALENFLNNKDQYTEAWDAARWYLNDKYKDDPTMLDALNDFITSGINIESMSSGIDTDIKKAMNDIGVKTKDIIRKSNADKDSTSKQIAEMLMKDHNLSNEDADTMANFIIERFNQHIADASERALKNRFAPKDKKAKKTFEKDFYDLANMGAFTNENWKDAVSKKLFGHEITIDENLIEEFRNAADQDSRDAVMEKIYQDIGHKIPTTFAEAANQWRYTAMLLNPSTHIKNMGGNLSMMAMKLLKDAAGTGIEKIANSVSGGKVGRTKSIINFFSKSDKALLQKAWADFGNVQDDVAGIGKNKDNVMGKVGEYRSYWKLNDPQGSTAKLVDGVLRGAEKVPQFNSKMLEAEDMIFSRPDYAVSLAEYMKANKLTEITAEARAYAIKEAQKATFRDANAVSKFARKIGTGDHKFWNWVANAIFPFKGTPANVGVRAFEYSPAGLLKALTYDIYRVKTGKISAIEYIDNLSSGLTGSALAAVGYYLAQAGFLRATGVGDEKEKEQQREQGYKDNSFTLLGYSIPEMVLTSLSAPMFVGAAFYEALATKALSGEAYDWDDIFQVLAATADPILGQTMLDGLSDTFYTIRSAQGGMGEVTSALALNTVGNYISSFMPTILSRISSAADSVGRETYVDKNKQMKGVQKEAQGLMMKTPARQMLHEKVDNYGRVQETWMSDENDGITEKAMKFAANVVTPSYPSKIKTSDVEDELSRLYHSGVDTSYKKVFQTEAEKYITVDGQKVNLTQDQHEQFEKTRGKNTMEYQGALQENSTYEKLDDELKINATDKMYDFIEQTSKESLNIGYEPEQWVSDLKGKSKEEISDVIMLKTIESYVKSDIFSGKYDGITSMLESGNIDEAMAVSMLPKEAEDGYFNQIKGSGIEISTFIDVYQFKTDARSDYDKDGKTVKSAQEKVIEYINRVEKSPEKKRRLFLSMGYAESKIPEEWK